MELLSLAESVLGSRDISKKIYQPQFTDDGPQIRNTLSMDGAFTELSRACENSWSETVFEMAHETVHLLNPTSGNTNYLEEGIAVAFSLRVQPTYGICILGSLTSYFYALQLVYMLPEDPIRIAKHLRERVGPLSEVTEQHLMELLPNVPETILNGLSQKFVR